MLANKSNTKNQQRVTKNKNRADLIRKSCGVFICIRYIVIHMRHNRRKKQRNKRDFCFLFCGWAIHDNLSLLMEELKKQIRKTATIKVLPVQITSMRHNMFFDWYSTYSFICTWKHILMYMDCMCIGWGWYGEN